MTKKVKTTWLKALRSGKYKQGEGFLKFNNEYCCLGVARACGLGVKKSEEQLLTDDFLPQHTQTALACMNDGTNESKKSFKQIANWIEKNL